MKMDSLVLPNGAVDGALLQSDATGTASWAVGAGGATGAKYIVQQADPGLTAEQALGDLATGILKSETVTGVVSIAVAGTDYIGPGDGAALTGVVHTTGAENVAGVKTFADLPVLGTLDGMVKATAGVLSAAIEGTDYPDVATIPPIAATYITQTPAAELTGSQALSPLATGMLKSTTGTGLLSIGAPDIDYLAPNGNGSALHSLNAAALLTGVAAPERLGTGTPDVTVFLRGDGVWAVGVAGPKGDQGVSSIIVGNFGAVATPAGLPPTGLIPIDWDGPGKPAAAYQMVIGESLYYDKAGDALDGHLFQYIGTTVEPSGWLDVGMIQGPVGPEGPIGPMGPPGVAADAAPSLAKYIIQTPDALLTGAQALTTLTDGLLKNTAATGVLSIAVAGTDYWVPGTAADGALLTGVVHTVGDETIDGVKTFVAPPIIDTLAGMLKATAGLVSVAVPGTDYVDPATASKIFRLAFAEADITATAGVLTVTHNLAQQFVQVSVYDGANEQIIPGKVKLTDANSLTIDIADSTPITGTWNVVVVG